MTEPHSTKDQKIVTPSNFTSDRTLNAVANCSSVLNSAFLIRRTRLERGTIRLSSQLISSADLRLNQTRSPIPTSRTARKLNPIIRTQPNSAAELVGLNQSRLIANIRTTVMVS